MKAALLAWLLLAAAPPNLWPGEEFSVSVAPGVAAVQREGITGAGWAVAAGPPSAPGILLLYPNHPDDFGGSVGTGASRSPDGGITWEAATDDWPLAGCVDLWAGRLGDGRLIAFGMKWAPNPKLRGSHVAADVPGEAYAVALSSDQGLSWTAAEAVIECPPELGVIARPLPPILDQGEGRLLMPAYAWSRSGTRALLLESADLGRSWRVRSVIVAAADIVKSGVPVTTPWLETAVAVASDGSLLAVTRTGSNENAALMASRSGDEGRSWEGPEPLLAGPERQPVAGKLPSLLLLPDGPLALLTAHTKFGCVLHLSADGTGAEWSGRHVVTAVSGGNTSMAALGPGELIVVTPARRRINAWRVSLSRER